MATSALRDLSYSGLPAGPIGAMAAPLAIPSGLAVIVITPHYPPARPGPTAKSLRAVDMHQYASLYWFYLLPVTVPTSAVPIPSCQCHLERCLLQVSIPGLLNLHSSTKSLSFNVHVAVPCVEFPLITVWEGGTMRECPHACNVVIPWVWRRKWSCPSVEGAQVVHCTHPQPGQ